MILSLYCLHLNYYKAEITNFKLDFRTAQPITTLINCTPSLQQIVNIVFYCVAYY